MLLNISLIDRYIVKQLIRPWIFSVAICTVLGETIGITFEQISFVSELEFPLTAALQVHLFKLPAFLSLALPFSVLMATIVVYNQLSRKNEIVALQSCGTSLIRLIVPAVILSSVLACLMFSLDAVIVPAANYKAAIIIENEFEIDRNDLGKYQKRNIIYQEFWDSEKQQDLRYLLVVDKVDGQKLNGFTLLNFDRNNLHQIIIAETATWNEQENLWNLFNGSQHIIDRNGNYKRVEYFDLLAETANNFANTIAFTDESIDGNLRSEDNSYIFNNESYFYDLYSVDRSVFDSGDLVKITLTSEDFDPLLFVLDSRGNVVEFDSNADGGDSKLAFIVGSGEPLFVAVESSNAKATGDYNITFDKVVDISGVNPNGTNIDNIPPLFGVDTIQTTDSLSGSITTEDVQIIDTSEIFYQDNVLLVDGSVGDRVVVSLESDFDAELSVSSIDPNGNTNVVANVDNQMGAGVERSTFTIASGLDYIFTIDTLDPDVTGSYTLNTELI